MVGVDIDSSVLLEPQKDISCRVDEVAVAYVCPGGVADAVVEGDRVGRGDADLAQRASCDLVGTGSASRTSLVPAAKPCRRPKSSVPVVRVSETLLIHEASQAGESERSLMRPDHGMGRRHPRAPSNPAPKGSQCPELRVGNEATGEFDDGFVLRQAAAPGGPIGRPARSR